mgnify:CR=1 FL=1
MTAVATFARHGDGGWAVRVPLDDALRRVGQQVEVTRANGSQTWVECGAVVRPGRKYSLLAVVLSRPCPTCDEPIRADCVGCWVCGHGTASPA